MKINRMMDNNQKLVFIEQEQTKEKFNHYSEKSLNYKKLEDLDVNSILNKGYDFQKDQELDRKARYDLSRKIAMIDKKFARHCPLVRFNLYAFFAAQKQGKTSIAAAIAHSLYQQGLKSLVITNEELSKDVRGRIAAIELGHNYNNFILGRYEDPYICEAIEKERQNVARHVDVISGEDADTMDADVICKILDSIGGLGYEVVIIDYISKVSTRSKVKVNQPWEAQEHLMYFLDEFKRRTDKDYPPVVVFSQIQKDNIKKPVPFKSRIEGRKLLPNFATGVYEIIKAPDCNKTIIDIVASRWYSGVDQWVFDFNNGRFTSSSENEEV